MTLSKSHRTAGTQEAVLASQGLDALHLRTQCSVPHPSGPRSSCAWGCWDLLKLLTLWPGTLTFRRTVSIPASELPAKLTATVRGPSPWPHTTFSSSTVGPAPASLPQNSCDPTGLGKELVPLQWGQFSARRTLLCKGPLNTDRTQDVKANMLTKSRTLALNR